MESCTVCLYGRSPVDETLDLPCDGGHDHIGWSWTSAACSYWRGFPDAIVQCWFCRQPNEQTVIKRSTAYRSGFVVEVDDETFGRYVEFLAVYTSM